MMFDDLKKKKNLRTLVHVLKNYLSSRLRRMGRISSIFPGLINSCGKALKYANMKDFAVRFLDRKFV